MKFLTLPLTKENQPTNKKKKKKKKGVKTINPISKNLFLKLLKNCR